MKSELKLSINNNIYKLIGDIDMICIDDTELAKLND